ncbi:MAG: outer membrane beta-barrel protein [Muribaculaceae bacterium]|nr:outer membrane beta-barrel protein [Muribaculaceae bacterium]
MKKLLFILACLLATCTTVAQSGDKTLGFYAGLGCSLPTSSLHDNFDGCVNFNGGLTGSYRHFVLKADVAYGQPSFNNDNLFKVYEEFDGQQRDAQINATSSASQVNVSVQLGYRISLNKRLNITPSAGFFWSRYHWNVNDIEWSKNPDGLDVFQIKHTDDANLSSPGWIASVDFDIRLHDRYISDVSLMGGQSRYSSFLRITPWVAHASYDRCDPHVKGCFVGINLNYFGLLQSLKSSD